MKKTIHLEDLILESLLTEKSVFYETKQNTVSIYAPLSTTKTLIAKAFKNIFDVDVQKVRSLITLGKTKRNRRTGKTIYGSKKKKFFTRVDNINKIINKIYEYSNSILQEDMHDTNNKEEMQIVNNIKNNNQDMSAKPEQTTASADFNSQSSIKSKKPQKAQTNNTKNKNQDMSAKPEQTTASADLNSQSSIKSKKPQKAQTNNINQKESK